MTNSVQDRFSIVVSATRGSEPTRVLKHDETFAVLDRHGDVLPIGLGEHGLYHLGVRHLSRMELGLSGWRPLLLSSTVRENNDLLDIDLTNADIPLSADDVLARDLLHLHRSVLLWKGACYQRLRLVSYADAPLGLSLSLSFDADFADIFEVRGALRKRRGAISPPEIVDGALVLAYEGLDGVTRRTRISWTPGPVTWGDRELTWRATLEPRQAVECLATIVCESNEAAERPAMSYGCALQASSQRMAAERTRQATIETGNDQFNAWIRRSAADLQMMTTETAAGPYPYAGVPWFSTVFGRDGLITALQLLWTYPAVARGVLGVLAAAQADTYDASRDAEPGKILHETRAGEMAALGEIPFGRYYGTVDATPLFVLLAGEYWRRTADLPFAHLLWPAIRRALDWMDRDGDRDADGFVEYHRQSPAGLVQQGWKDSHDSVFHADGMPAVGPIALCEVQAYVYAARLAAAEIADVVGEPARAQSLRAQAANLRQHFEAAFWLEDLSTYALALDGAKRPCRVVSSNAGQCLFTGITGHDHALRVARRLMEDDAYSGWGIRTIAENQARYNPMAYHNGSVWPHDTALIALGLGRHRQTALAGRLATGLFEASLFVELHRLPELFCGFRRRPGQGPTLYPVACAPQAWAAGAVFMMVQACLGLTVDAVRREIRFTAGLLPEHLPWVRISNLAVGDASVDLHLERHSHDVGIHVLRRTGAVEIVTIK
jgi:glycogen debranching enzyme